MLSYQRCLFYSPQGTPAVTHSRPPTGPGQDLVTLSGLAVSTLSKARNAGSLLTVTRYGKQSDLVDRLGVMHALQGAGLGTRFRTVEKDLKESIFSTKSSSFGNSGARWSCSQFLSMPWGEAVRTCDLWPPFYVVSPVGPSRRHALGHGGRCGQWFMKDLVFQLHRGGQKHQAVFPKLA